MPRRYKFVKDIKQEFLESSETNNTEDVDVPEHFKYGIYFDDDYDYMKHLVHMKDFVDPNYELPIIEKEKFETPTKEDSIDTDLLNSLNAPDEIIDDEKAEDFFGNIIKSGALNDNVNFDETSNLKPDYKEKNTYIYEDMIASLKEVTDEVRNENEGKIFKIPDENNDKYEDISEMKGNVFYNENIKRYMDQTIKSFNLELSADEAKELLKKMPTHETEYDEKELDEIINDWYNNRKLRPTKTPFQAFNKKISKNQPKKMRVMNINGQGTKRKKSFSQESIEEVINDCVATSTFVHKSRSKNETADEKKDRKKEIKEAKRARRIERKEKRETLKRTI